MKYWVLIFYIIGHSTFAQTKEEKLVELINLVRTDPKDFVTSHLKPYLETHEQDDDSYANSLLAELEIKQKVEPLTLSSQLSKVSKQHAIDLGKKGQVGHYSSDGTTFDKRLRTRAKAGGTIGENCDYGNEEPLDILMSLLIDEGVTSLGHRKNLLEGRFKFIGIAIEPHKKYRMSCVMDFAEKF